MENLLIVLSQQIQSCQNIAGMIQSLAYNAQEVIKQEMTEEDKKDQVKSLMASATIQMNSLNSQDILAQQTIDKILELVNG